MGFVCECMNVELWNCGNVEITRRCQTGEVGGREREKGEG